MTDIYKSIAERTGGHIYLGVVGPVRTGKSTFIERFMRELLLPGIKDPVRRERALMELPQSGSGRTIMTAEPKFIPEEAVEVSFPGEGKAMVRLIDSVGYLIEGAMGVTEEGEPRMVRTPWSEKEITVEQAAREGTGRVIREHSTIGILVTTDGTVTGFEREVYEQPEEETVRVLRESGVPFVIVLNTSDTKTRLAAILEEKYGCAVVAMNCAEATGEDMTRLMERVLYRFPVLSLSFSLPEWFGSLESTDETRMAVTKAVLEAGESIDCLADVQKAVSALADVSPVTSARVLSVDAGKGAARAELTLPREIFYDVLTRRSGVEITGERQLVNVLTELASTRDRALSVAVAMDEVMSTGSGVIMPPLADVKLEEPELIRQAGRCGVKLRASAPAIHMMMTEIKTEVAPIVGDERQSEELLRSLRERYEGDLEELWKLNIFGKTLRELVEEGFRARLGNLTPDAGNKFRATLQKVINEGNGTLICIML